MSSAFETSTLPQGFVSLNELSIDRIERVTAGHVIAEHQGIKLPAAARPGQVSAEAATAHQTEASAKLSGLGRQAMDPVAGMGWQP